MGADFLYSCFPKINVTKKRVKEFTKIINDAPDNEVGDIGYDTPDEHREKIIDAFKELLTIKNKTGTTTEFALRRDVSTIALADGIEYIITGGMSYGDSPTDAFDILNILDIAVGTCEKLQIKIYEWAKFDQRNINK